MTGAPRTRPLAALLALVALTACPRTDPARAPGTVVVAFEGAPATLDPRRASDAYAVRILDAALRGLFRCGPDGTPLPDLATTATWRDARTLDVGLRAGQRFHDGTALTPAAVARSLDTLRDPAWGGAYAGVLAPIAAVTALADGVRLTLSEPYAPILDALRAPVLHPLQATAATIDMPIGSGPYRIAARSSDDTVVLERVGAAPTTAVTRIVVRAIGDPMALVFALEAGEVDLALNAVPAHEVVRLRDLPHLRVDQRSGWNVSYLGFHHGHGALSDARVRRALAMAIDRAAIVHVLLRDTAQTTSTLIPSQSWAAAAVRGPAYDPGTAMALLDAAGLPDPDGAGPLPRLRLSYKTSTNPERVRIAQAIAADWRRVGVSADVRSLDFATLFADVQAGDVEVYGLTWVGVVEPDLLYMALHSRSVPPAGANRGHVNDATLDEQLNAARRALDGQQRRGLYAAAQARIAATQPVAPLWVHDAVVVRHERLHGFAPDPGGGLRALAAATLAGTP